MFNHLVGSSLSNQVFLEIFQNFFVEYAQLINKINIELLTTQSLLTLISSIYLYVGVNVACE